MHTRTHTRLGSVCDMTADTHSVAAEKTFSTAPSLSSSMFFGHTCESGLMPALVRPAIPALPPALRMKRFLPFPLDTASPVRLLPGFGAMDPVQQALLHHTLGLPPTTKRKHASCSVCRMRFNSQSQALAHLKGTKHAKKLKALDAPKSKLKGSGVTKDSANPEISKGVTGSGVTNCSEGTDSTPGFTPLILSPALKEARASASSLTLSTPSLALAASPLLQSATSAACSETSRGEAEEERPPELTPEAEQEAEPDVQAAAPAATAADSETEEEKARRLLYCSLCKVAVNSASQLEAHNSGTKHKTMLEARTGVGSIKSFPRPGVKSKLAASTKSTGLQNKTFYCETCDVHVNSDTQLKQHISSRRHKDRAAGKPAKHKYSPYTKTPKGPAKQPIKLSLGKEHQCQPLSARIIPAHLVAMAAAAAAAAIGGSVTHRTNPATSHAASPTGLFQTQGLSAALLRPAPGPIRTSHPQVLFAPY